MKENLKNSMIDKSNDLKVASSDYELLAEVGLGNEDAKQELFSRHEGTIVAVVAAYLGSGLDLDLLKLNAASGLKKSIQKFKVELGFDFSTYALQWIGGFVENEAGRQMQLFDTLDLALVNTSTHEHLITIAHKAIDRGVVNKDVPTVVCKIANELIGMGKINFQLSADTDNSFILDSDAVAKLLAVEGYRVYFCASSRLKEQYRQDFPSEMKE
jgi:hypothetical protein